MSLIRTAFTGADNNSVDIGRVLWAFLTVIMAALEAWVVVRGQAFDALGFATASAAMLTAGGAALAFKKGTEPEAPKS